MDDSAARLDGNAAAGDLGELFAFEVTTTEVVCLGCGAAAPVGAIAAYGLPMGVVLRCAHCDAVVMRAARTPRGTWLDMRGSGIMRVMSSPAPELPEAVQ